MPILRGGGDIPTFIDHGFFDKTRPPTLIKNIKENSTFDYDKMIEAMERNEAFLAEIAKVWEPLPATLMAHVCRRLVLARDKGVATTVSNFAVTIDRDRTTARRLLARLVDLGHGRLTKHGRYTYFQLSNEGRDKAHQTINMYMKYSSWAK